LGTAINGGSNDLDFQGYLFVDSDATGGTNSILMSGVGTWPPADPSVQLDFGKVPMGITYQRALLLTNTGDASVTVTNIAAPDGFAALGFWTTATIAPGSAINIYVNFTPSGIGKYEGPVTIASDATAPGLVVVTPEGNVTNSGSGFNVLDVSGTGTYPTGNFLGLFAPTNDVAFENSGYFTAESTAKGMLRATLTLAGKRYPFSAEVSPSGAVSKTIARKKLPALNVSLKFGGFSRGWNGTISDGTWTAQLTSEPAPLLTSRSVHAVPPGNYTFTILGNTNASTEAPTQSGTGAISLKVSDVVRVTGTLGDGTRYFQNAIMCSPNHIPFYAPLYQNRGAIMGWISFQHQLPPPPEVILPIVEVPRQTNLPVTFPPFPPVGGVSTITLQPPPLLPVEASPLAERATEVQLYIVGTLHWFKPAGIDRHYPDGFSFETEVSGSTVP